MCNHHLLPALPPVFLVLVNGSLFTVSYKDLGFLSSGFFSSNTTPCMCRCHLALFMSPCGIGAQATGTKMLILWVLPLLWLINWPSSLTQESRVFYQHPWTCGSLTGQLGRSGKISDPSQFQTLVAMLSLAPAIIISFLNSQNNLLTDLHTSILAPYRSQSDYLKAKYRSC